MSITPRFVRAEDLLKAKYRYEALTGESGARPLYFAFEAMQFLMLTDFKLSLELRLLLDFNFSFNFNLDFTFPFQFTFKAVYGPLEDWEREEAEKEGKRVGAYGVDVYDPEAGGLEHGGRAGPRQGLEEAGWRLSYKYISHYRYGAANPLWHGRSMAGAYVEYFHASPEHLLEETHLDSSMRLAEALYQAACWYDFNSYDIGRYSLEVLFFRFPKGEAPPGSITDQPIYDYDSYDQASYDIYPRPEAIYVKPIDELALSRYDFSFYDVARYGLGLPISADGIQREVDDYKLRSRPLVAAAIWLVSGEDMKRKGLTHLAWNWFDRMRVKDLLANEGVPLMDVPNYYKFMLEYKYNSVTAGYAGPEDIIRKYARLGLREDLLRRIAQMVARA